MEPGGEVDGVAREVIGAAIEVHRHLGPGFCEAVYEAALVHELSLRRIPCRSQVPVRVGYKHICVGEGRLDLLVADRVVVELKSVEKLCNLHRAQLLSYLKATEMRLGLLINFNVQLLRNGIKRIVLT